MLSFIPDALKLPAVGAGMFIVGAAIVGAPAYLYGRHEQREAIELEAARAALDRIRNLEKNNADFKKLPSRDRCLFFMRDSGLPVSACD